MKSLYPISHVISGNTKQSLLKRILFLLFVLLFAISTFGFGGGEDDKPTELIFKNSVLVSGVAGQDGAVYKFAKVGPKTDALVTIVKRSDPLVSILNIDIADAGWDKAFQPQVTYNNNTTPAGYSDWWAEFEISFVKEGTNIPTTVSSFDLSGIDIDGNGQYINENVTFYGAESYTLEANSLLNISNVIDPATGLVIGKKFAGPIQNFISIDTSGTAVMTTNSYKNVNKFRMRAGGSSTNASGAADRLYAFWFKGFRYQSAMEIFLPVRFTAFTAKINNGKNIQLNWDVVEEENVSHYIVEKSSNGKEYTQAGVVFTLDKRKDKNSYGFKDETSVSTKALVFYRLRIITIDGDFAYSSTRIIKTGIDENTLAIATYPNPVANELRITIPQSWQDKQVVYDVYNTNGRMVKHIVKSKAGQTESVNVSDMAKGMYFVKATTENASAIERIVKAN